MMMIMIIHYDDYDYDNDDDHENGKYAWYNINMSYRIQLIYVWHWWKGIWPRLHRCVFEDCSYFRAASQPPYIKYTSNLSSCNLEADV